MEKDFVTYDQAVALKELGLDKPCFVYYNPNGVFMWKILCSDEDNDHTLSIKDIMEHKAEGYIEAPLKQQVFRWFREKYGYWSYNKEATKGTCRFYIEKFDEKFFNSVLFGSYEETENACIDKLIELVKNK